MKKYSTGEMIKALEKNRKLRFRNKFNVEVYINKLGFIHCNKTLDGNINIVTEWELVQQPVSFMEAVKTDKRVRVEHELLSDEFYEYYNSLDTILYNAAKDVTSLSKVILEGKWYIKE